MAGWLAQGTENCLQKFPKDIYSHSHCLPRPTDTAGLPNKYIWEGSRISRAGVCPGCAKAARCDLYRKSATLRAHAT
eukprot:1148645-Pelagomonas_calceolata.AAC.2